MLKNKKNKEKTTKQKKRNDNGEKSLLLSAIKGLGTAFTITCIVFVICAFVITYTDIKDSFVGIVSIICTAVSALAAGKIWASAFGKKGLIMGAMAGAVYGIILLGISVASGGGPLTLGAGTCVIVAAARGGIGGIIGVN